MDKTMLYLDHQVNQEGQSMAKYDVTYTCGHTGTIRLIGRDRQWRLEQEKEKLCSECYRAALEQERQEGNARAAIENQAAGLAELEGTEKQIAWAETLRRQFLDIFEGKILPEITDEQKAAHPEACEGTLQIYRSFRSRTSASWWIDNRSLINEYRLPIMIKNEKEALAQAQNEPPAHIIEEAQAEATVYPPDAVSNLVTDIEVRGNTISVLYPERNEKFREIMHSLNLKWERRWLRTIGNRSGDIEDRVAEIGNKLLAAGFPVRIYDAAARQKAIDGTYEPEPIRWITAIVSGQYIGWLCVNWSKKEDFYTEAKRIAGSRYCKPHVVVPAENYEEVLDFAGRYEFKITDKAQEIIDAAMQVRETALVTGVKVPKSQGPAKPERPQLDPEEIGIDEELRDEN